MLPDEQILEAMLQGKICLHPAGTLPGLTCHLNDSSAVDRLLALKGRSNKKPFIGLVANFARAFSYWRPISGNWQSALEHSWPGPLTVVSQSNYPTPLSGDNQTLALRVPNFAPEDKWMLRLLENIETPLLSTSVNLSGERAATNWQDAIRFANSHHIFVPTLDTYSSSLGVPSTVIEIIDEDSFVLLREGGFDIQGLKKFGLISKPGIS